MAGRLDARPIDRRGEPVAPPHPLGEFWHYFSENKRRGRRPRRDRARGPGRDLRRPDRAAPPAEQYREHFLAPPVWMAGGSLEFLLGTDAVGRDILSRIIYGARFSLMIGLIVVTLSLSASASSSAWSPASSAAGSRP